MGQQPPILLSNVETALRGKTTFATALVSPASSSNAPAKTPSKTRSLESLPAWFLAAPEPIWVALSESVWQKLAPAVLSDTPPGVRVRLPANQLTYVYENTRGTDASRYFYLQPESASVDSRPTMDDTNAEDLPTPVHHVPRDPATRRARSRVRFAPDIDRHLLELVRHLWLLFLDRDSVMVGITHEAMSRFGYPPPPYSLDDYSGFFEYLVVRLALGSTYTWRTMDPPTNSYLEGFSVIVSERFPEFPATIHTLTQLLIAPAKIAIDTLLARAFASSSSSSSPSTSSTSPQWPSPSPSSSVAPTAPETKTPAKLPAPTSASKSKGRLPTKKTPSSSAGRRVAGGEREPEAEADNVFFRCAPTLRHATAVCAVSSLPHCTS